MKPVRFHHPDFCPTVTARQLSLEILEMLEGVGRFISSGGRSITWSGGYPSQGAYRTAVWRLRKAGLIAYRRSRGQSPVLILTEEGTARLSDACRPERCWRRKWNGIWYVLAYDVPEKERPYREALRGFLKRLRMGRLQDSFWVSPWDIRAEYADLIEAGGVDEYAIMLEAQTVLGQGPEAIVRHAWAFDRLEAAHKWFLEACAAQFLRVRGGHLPQTELLTLAREELTAYRAVMNDDPLLPRVLWPAGYRGPEVYAVHREFQRAVARHL